MAPDAIALRNGKSPSHTRVNVHRCVTTHRSIRKPGSVIQMSTFSELLIIQKSCSAGGRSLNSNWITPRPRRERGRVHVSTHIPHQETRIQFAAAEVAARPSLAPLAKSEDNWFELLARNGQVILHSLPCARTAPFNNTRFLECLQSIRQHGWRQ